ncbi:hypothetical protein JTB14_003868 [Gonioctena quinquepunctata]|nr:hypothetical protein JTB14_003868 [Gonioctena quinquepunctata]
MYYVIFNNEFNIGFFSPKEDQCDLCIVFVNASEDEKLQLQEKYDNRLEEKVLSRLQEKKDKDSNTIVAIYDLQAVMPCPTGNASSFSYVSKLNIFNLTICYLQSNEVT